MEVKEEWRYVEDEQATPDHHDLNHAHKYLMEVWVDDEVQPVMVAVVDWDQPIFAAAQVTQAYHCPNYRRHLLGNAVPTQPGVGISEVSRINEMEPLHRPISLLLLLPPPPPELEGQFCAEVVQV